MKTKLLNGTVVAMMVLSSPLFADSSHHQKESPANTMQSNGMAMMDMKKMDDHMNKMKETMAQIHRAENKEERQKLMQQHMQEMQQGMSMMSGGMAGSVSGKKGGHGGMVGTETMKNCHGMMEQRIDMMQGMMGQMMEQMMQQQKMIMDK